MKIVEIRDAVVPIASDIRNAYIDFSKMTASVVAVMTDVIRDGKPVVGYGFNSNGRYGASGLLRERFLPRLREAAPEALLDDRTDNFDPHRIWQVMMTNEKPGGHGERSVAVGTVDMAVWDAVAKIAGVPLYRLLAERYGDGKPDEKVFVYAAGGYYYPGKDDAALQDEMRTYLDPGYAVVKMKIGGDSLSEDLRRIEAVIAVIGAGRTLAVDANGRFDLQTAIAYGEALAPYDLFWYEEAGDPLDYALQAELARHDDRPMATGENCSRIRMPATCCAMAECGRIATGCNSTARCLTALSNICARSRCCRTTASRRATAFPMAAINCRSISLPVCILAAMKAIPAVCGFCWLCRRHPGGGRIRQPARRPRHRL